MIKKLSRQDKSDYVLVILLLVFSGNPIIRFGGNFAPFLLLALIFVINFNKIRKDFYLKIFFVFAALLILFMSQNLVLNFVSWPGAFNYISVFFLGGVFFYLISDRFSYKFFIVVYYISIISLVLYFIINILNIHPPGLQWKPERITYIIYTFVEEHHYRNCGMFWEPGAFAGILTLCIALNAKDFPILWKMHKFKIFIIIVALLTTKSTTGYIVFFLIVMYYFVFFLKNKLIMFVILPTLLIVMVIVYENAEFLQQKIDDQSEKTQSISKGDYHNSRFGSFTSDLHYIQKHPLVGNGFHEKTRYADDPEILLDLKSGGNVASGNGFSNFMACLGIPFMFFYLLLTFKTISKTNLKTAFLVVFVMLLSLWGEQWLYYPIYTGLLFLNIKNSI